jgi:hypothetical protein
VLLVNADRYPEGMPELMAVASSPLLGLLALLRFLRGEPAPLALAPTAESLVPPVFPRTIRGTLSDGRIPSSTERPALTARLRSAWPIRRFPLRPQTPRWLWECLHLLGISAQGGTIDLSLPETWLVADFGEPLAELIREEFTLESLVRHYPAQTVLKLRRGSYPETPCIIGGFKGRVLTREWMQRGGRGLLALALDLPENLFRLLEEGRLGLPGESDGALVQQNEREVYLFSRSSLGRYLWGVITGSPSPPQRKNLFRDALRFGLPLPPAEILASLRRIPWLDGESPPPVETIDEELSLWLGGDLEMAEADDDRPMRRGGGKSSPPPPDPGTEAEIAAAVFVDGLPRFPEQYLYDYYRPSLREYAFPGPLTMGDEFFGRFTLLGPEGFRLEVEGAETARAIQLCSHTGGIRTALPADRHLTAEILERYLADLKELRQVLVRRTHGKIPDPKTAAGLVEKIWKAQPLPPWPLLAG